MLNLLDAERRQGLCVDKDGRTIAVSGEICVCIYCLLYTSDAADE